MRNGILVVPDNGVIDEEDEEEVKKEMSYIYGLIDLAPFVKAFGLEKVVSDLVSTASAMASEHSGASQACFQETAHGVH